MNSVWHYLNLFWSYCPCYVKEQMWLQILKYVCVYIETVMLQWLLINDRKFIAWVRTYVVPIKWTVLCTLSLRQPPKSVDSNSSKFGMLNYSLDLWLLLIQKVQFYPFDYLIEMRETKLLYYSSNVRYRELSLLTGIP